MQIDRDKLALQIVKNKEGALNWQQRRHQDWTDNYTLYRDKVIINRFIQRQSINMPLMKYSIKTGLAQIDEPPELTFEELGNQKNREIFINEYFKDSARRDKLVIKDTVDKKNDFLYGRTDKLLNLKDGKVFTEIKDPLDFLLDRYLDPADIDGTAQFKIYPHIYKPLRLVAENPEYEKLEVQKLQAFFATKMGLIKSAENRNSAVAKNQRMETMGVPDIDNPILGEVYIELNVNLMKLWDPSLKKFIIYKVTTCDPSVVPEEASQNIAILSVKPLDEVIGKTIDDYWQDHYPDTSWADDVEGTDPWSDSMGDIVRPTNKVFNIWVSQMVENRTLRNFGMNFYDATKELKDGNPFVPQTFDPVPFGFYPLPGKPVDVLQNVQIPDLAESINEMKFMIEFIERATAITATQQGIPSTRQITLGEIQMTVAAAQERVHSTAKFYNESWREYGEKWLKFVEATSDKLSPVKIYKRNSPNSPFYEREVNPADWKSSKGFHTHVEITGEKMKKDLDSIEKLTGIKATMPTNEVLDDIYKRKILGIALEPDEVAKVMEEEKKMKEIPPTETTIMPKATPNQPAVVQA